MAKNETKVDITGDASGLDKEAKRGAGSLRHMGKEGERAADKASEGARKTTSRMERLRGKIGEVGKRFGPMGQAASGALGALLTPIGAVTAAVGGIAVAVKRVVAAFEEATNIARQLAQVSEAVLNSQPVQDLLEARGAFGPGAQAAVTEDVMATAAMRGQDSQQVAAMKNLVSRLTTAGAISEGDAGKIENEALQFAALHGGTRGTESLTRLMTQQFGMSGAGEVARGFRREAGAAAAVGVTDGEFISLLQANADRAQKLGMSFDELIDTAAKYSKQFGAKGGEQLGQGLGALERLGESQVKKLGEMGIKLLGALRVALGGKQLGEQRRALADVFGGRGGTALLPALQAPDAELAGRLAKTPDFDAEEAQRRQSAPALLAGSAAAKKFEQMKTTLADAIVDSIESDVEARVQRFQRDQPRGAALPGRVAVERVGARQTAINRQAEALLPQLRSLGLDSLTEEVEGQAKISTPELTATDNAAVLARARLAIAKAKAARASQVGEAAPMEVAPATARPTVTREGLAQRAAQEMLRREEVKRAEKEAETTPAAREPQRSKPRLSSVEQELRDQLDGSDDRATTVNHVTNHHHDQRTIWEFGRDGRSHRPQDDYFDQGGD